MEDEGVISASGVQIQRSRSNHVDCVISRTQNQIFNIITGIRNAIRSVENLESRGIQVDGQRNEDSGKFHGIGSKGTDHNISGSPIRSEYVSVVAGTSIKGVLPANICQYVV